MGAREIASASFLASCLALAGPFPDVSAAPAPPPAFALRESLAQSLHGTGPLTNRSIAFVEVRRAQYSVRVPLGAADPATFTGDTLLGLRVGGLQVEQPLASDPRWRTGQRQATFRIQTGSPGAPEVHVLRARWTRGELRLELRSHGRAPLSEDLTGAEAGPAAAPVDAAARLGSDRWRFAGSAEGAVVRTTVPLPGSTADLARVELRGTGLLLRPSDDTVAPSATLETPAPDALLPQGSVTVSGTVRDDESLESLRYSLDSGPETVVPILRDPASGFLTAATGTFSFLVDPVPGRNHLTVTVRDAVGNVGTASVDFAIVVPRSLFLAAGANHALAPDSTGVMRMWGNPSYAYAAGGTSTTPYPIPGADMAVAVAAGQAHSLALFPDGTVRSWGSNAYGQLGIATTPQATTVTEPTEVPGLSGIVAVAAEGYSSMALRADGAVFAWGSNAKGQAGNGTVAAVQTTPVRVPGLPPVRSIAVGGGVRIEWNALYAVDEDGFLWSWGDNTVGQLAILNVSQRQSTVPIQSPFVSGAVTVAGGGDGFAVTLNSDGTVWGWGNDADGAIPGGGYSGYSFPHLLPGASGIAAVACGGDFTLLLKGDGTVLACGHNNRGQLGNGTTFTPDVYAPEPDPAPVPGLAGIRSIACGQGFGFAIRDDGAHFAWGANASGQLGDGSRTDRTSPVLVLLDQ